MEEFEDINQNDNEEIIDDTEDLDEIDETDNNPAVLKPPLNVSVMGILVFLCIALIGIFFCLGRASAKVDFNESETPLSAVNAVTEAITTTTTEVITTTTEPPTEPEPIITEEQVWNVLALAENYSSEVYSYSSAEVYETSKTAWGVKVPFTTDMFIFSCDGEITVGIDTDEVLFEIDNDSKTVTFVLPEPEIISHTVDESSFEFRDAKNSIFNNTSIGDYSNIITEQKQKQEEKLLKDNSFFSSVTENAESIIMGLMAVYCEESGYTVIFA